MLQFHFQPPQYCHWENWTQNTKQCPIQTPKWLQLYTELPEPVWLNLAFHRVAYSSLLCQRHGESKLGQTCTHNKIRHNVKAHVFILSFCQRWHNLGLGKQETIIFTLQWLVKQSGELNWNSYADYSMCLRACMCVSLLKCKLTKQIFFLAQIMTISHWIHEQ